MKLSGGYNIHDASANQQLDWLHHSHSSWQLDGDDDNSSIDSLEEMIEFFPECSLENEVSMKQCPSSRSRDFSPKRIQVPYLKTGPGASFSTTKAMTTTTATKTTASESIKTKLTGSEVRKRVLSGSSQFLSHKTNQLKERVRNASWVSGNTREKIKVWAKTSTTRLSKPKNTTLTKTNWQCAWPDESCDLSVIANTTGTCLVNNSSPSCKCCTSKQEQIKQQEQEIQQLKSLVKGLVSLVAQQSQEAIPKIEMKKEAHSDAESVCSTVSSTTVSSMSCLSPSNSSSEGSPLPGPSSPRISLPLTTVSEVCTRSKKQRIPINGQYGMYSGPAIKNKACILQGCVVRMENGDLYVGSLSRNDTGSFTFHQPGTLYGSNASPKRRIRK
jgi:hypothetical protein